MGMTVPTVLNSDLTGSGSEHTDAYTWLEKLVNLMLNVTIQLTFRGHQKVIGATHLLAQTSGLTCLSMLSLCHRPLDWSLHGGVRSLLMFVARVPTDPILEPLTSLLLINGYGITCGTVVTHEARVLSSGGPRKGANSPRKEAVLARASISKLS